MALKLTGHRARSVFQRYAIVEERILKEAWDRLADGLASERGKVRPQSDKVAELKR